MASDAVQRSAIRVVGLFWLAIAADAEAGAVTGAGPKPAGPASSTIASKPIETGLVHGLTFVDGSRYLLLNLNSGLLLVDAARVEKVGDTVELDSVLVPSPYPPPHDRGSKVYFRDATWQWDDNAKTIVGGGLTAFGESYGPATWRPGESLPVALTGLPENICGPFTFSLDGALLAVRVSSHFSCGPYMNGWQLVDLTSRKPIGSPIETGLDSRLTFHRDGTLAAISDPKGGVRLVDTKTGNVTQLPDPPPSGVSSMEFHPTRHLLLVSYDDEILAWDLQKAPYKRSRLAVPEIRDDEWRSLRFSPNGKYLAIGTNNELSLRDSSDYRVVHRERASVDRIAFSPDSARLAISSWSKVIVVDLGGASPPPSAAAKPNWFAKLQRLPAPPAPKQPEITYDATIAGRVTANGRPVAGAIIELGPGRDEWPNARALKPRITRSGTDGQYRFDKAPRVDSYVSIKADSFQSGGGLFDLRKKPQQTYDPILEPGVVIKGKVLDPRGRPAPGIEVTADRGQEKIVVTTDKSGAFVIDHIGDYGFYPSNRLVARRKDGAVAILVFTTKPGTSMITRSYAFVVENGTTNEVVMRLRALDDPEVLRIMVTDASGKPAAGVIVDVNNSFRGETNAKGILTLEISDSQALIRAWTGNASGEADVDLPHKGPVRVVLKPR